MGFKELLSRQHDQGHHVCVGLDSDGSSLPDIVRGSARNPQLWFNRSIVDATVDFVGSYKLNLSFYLSNGDQGLEALVDSVAYIRQVAPDLPVILDGKFGDIGSSSEGYASFAYDFAGAHAVTVHPYLGSEAAEHFLSRSDRGVFVLCRSSNSGAGELQDLEIRKGESSGPLYLDVAASVRDRWNTWNNCGLVVGATYPTELAAVRALASELPLLIPGVGKQGGDLVPTVKAASHRGRLNALVNSSRSIIFASAGEDFADAARKAALDLHRRIRGIMAEDGPDA